MLSLAAASYAFVAPPSAVGSVRSVAHASPVSMGLATGDKFPAAALKAMDVSGKNAVVFFYGVACTPLPCMRLH